MTAAPPAPLSRRRLLVAAGAVGAAALAGTAGCSADDPAPAPPQAPPSSPDDTRVVAPDGDDDGTGSRADPWRTLARALPALRAGQTLLVADGEYAEDVDVRLAAGSREAPVRVRALEGGRPVLRGLLWLDRPTWWDIEGLSVTWARRGSPDEHMVKLHDGTDWRFAGAELSRARSFAALLVSGTPERFVVEDLYVHDTARANGTNQDHLVYLNCGEGGGILQRCLLVGSPNGRAVKIGPPDAGGARVAGVAVRHCTMVDNRGPSNVQLAYGVSDVVLERNIMVGSGDGRASVTAFELDGAGNLVRDNVCWQSEGCVEDAEGIQAERNLVLDPQLAARTAARPFLPQTVRAARYGRWAPRR